MSKIVLITGASSGFGEACARAFAAAGYALVLVARSEDKLQQLAAELRPTTAVHVACADMMDAAAVKALVQNLPEPFRAVDVLVNNAGLALGVAPAYDADLNDWETMVDTNIKGLMRITHHLLPGMVERNRGHIINIGSVAGNWPYPGGNVYGGTKAFVQQFSRNLRAELLGKQIRVTNLEPGMAETQFSIVRMKGNTRKSEPGLRKHPTTDRRGHRRYCALGSRSATARQHQHPGSHAHLPSLEPLRRQPRYVTTSRRSD